MAKFTKAGSGLLFTALLSVNLTADSEMAGSMNSFAEEWLGIMQQHKQENEEIIRANAIYYQNIVESARKYYSGYIGKKWGEENVKLSSRKVFTQYSKDMNSRENIDFEHGEVTMEIIADEKETVSPEVFEKKLKELKEQNIEQSLQKDPVAKLSQDYLTKKNIVSSEGTKKQEENFVKDLIDKTKIQEQEIKEKIVELKNGEKKKIISVTVKMVPKHLEKRASKYKPDVFEEAQRFNVKPSHIFGTMQAESYFNPLAISHIPAYGLMQIVPSTAGRDAYKALTGKNRLLPPPYLYDAEKNIELGTKYIQIIKERYLTGIENKETLFYCSATAYNAGIGTLLNSFNEKRGLSYKEKKQIFLKKVNSMTPDEVYNHLRTSEKLNEEARNYVKKIRDFSSNYHKWDS